MVTTMCSTRLPPAASFLIVEVLGGRGEKKYDSEAAIHEFDREMVCRWCFENTSGLKPICGLRSIWILLSFTVGTLHVVNVIFMQFANKCGVQTPARFSDMSSFKLAFQCTPLPRPPPLSLSLYLSLQLFDLSTSFSSFLATFLKKEDGVYFSRNLARFNASLCGPRSLHLSQRLGHFFIWKWTVRRGISRGGEVERKWENEGG